MGVWESARGADAPLSAPRHRLLFGWLLLILVWAPIPIGSNREWSMSLLAALAIALVGAWSLVYACRPSNFPDAFRSSRAAVVALALWVAYPLVQLLPLPMDVVTLLGGKLHGLYAELPKAADRAHGYLSLDRGATLNGLLRQCGMFALFSAILMLVTTRKRLRILMYTMLVVGFGEAFYGLVVYLAADGLGLWNPGQATGVVSSTYVNQNHFAGLMEMTIPIGLGLLLATASDAGGTRSGRDLLRMLAGLVLGQRGLVLFCVVVMAAALIMTTSRGGTGALAAGVAIAITIAVSTRGIRTRELRLGLVAVGVALVAILWLGTGQFSDKLRSAGLSSNRAELAEVSYRIIKDSPVVGTGVGTYRWVFPAYKDERFGGYFYEHAHNDFLEMMVEQGLVGFSFFLAALVLIFLRIVRAFAQRSDPLARGMLFATIAGCCSILVHGLVDFNLQIPANAAYFFVLLGAGTVACDLFSESSMQRSLTVAGGQA